MQNPILFVTGNANKAREVSQILGGLPVEARELEVVELQSMSLREVVEAKVRSAFATAGQPVMVEDVSLEYGALKGFPGPFVKFWNGSAGNDLAERIAKMENDTSMTARCGAAYFDGTTLLYAEGVVHGNIVARRGESGFGFDPYIVPTGETRTFAEMAPEEKNAVSHRFLAFDDLRKQMVAAGKI